MTKLSKWRIFRKEAKHASGEAFSKSESKAVIYPLRLRRKRNKHGRTTYVR